MIKDQAAEASIAGIAQKVGLSGGATAAIGGFTANEVAAFGGLLVAVVGLVIQWYYKRKDDRRSEALHRARMADSAATTLRIPSSPTCSRMRRR